MNKLRFLRNVQKHHSEQFDSQGAPYWLHPHRVSLSSEALLRQTMIESQDHKFFLDNPDFEDRIYKIGLYHDVIEDVPGSFEKVREELGNDTGMLRSLFLLTKPSEWIEEVSDYLTQKEQDLFRLAETYVEKIGVLISIGDPWAMIVKYCDNIDNSLSWRSKIPGKPNTKYIESKNLLEEALSEYFYA